VFTIFGSIAYSALTSPASLPSQSLDFPEQHHLQFANLPYYRVPTVPTRTIRVEQWKRHCYDSAQMDEAVEERSFPVRFSPTRMAHMRTMKAASMLSCSLSRVIRNISTSSGFIVDSRGNLTRLFAISKKREANHSISSSCRYVINRDFTSLHPMARPST
jgi:hypothetical protein